MIINRIFSLIILFIVAWSCNPDDDGTSTTGNTQAYFKYTVDGVERIFDVDVESHLETETVTSIDRFEFSASGLQNNGDLRRIAGSFTFVNSTFLLSNTPYNWGVADGITNMENFYFAESTVNHPFILTLNQAITAEIVTSAPNNLSDYFEFTFSGNFTELNGTTHTILGSCRAQRDADQNY